MQTENTYYPDRELLARYFSGECTPEEVTELETWRDSSAENTETLFRWQMVWIDTGTLIEPAPIQNLDLETAFAKVKARKKELETPKTQNHWWKLAAAAVILISIGFLGRLFLNQEEMLHELALSENKSVELQDGSFITLKSGSELSYSSEFGEEERKLELKGEAFFEVAHNPEKPFTVSAGALKVTVLGTSFNIKMLDQGYEVAVKTGRVQMEVGDRKTILTAGEKGIFDSENQQIENTAVASNGLDIFWKTNRLEFQGESLKEVVNAVADAYRVEISIANDQAAQCRFSGVFEGENIQQVLEVIALSQNLTLSQSNNTYLLSGQGCAAF